MMTKHICKCHCGAVEFEVEGAIENIVECNCSICAKRAHMLWFVPKAGINFVSGEANLTGYQFGKQQITHRFCKNCGIAMMSDGEQEGVIKAGINIRVIEGLDVTAFETYKYDGKKL